MRDIKEDTVEKIHVCNAWGGIPIYILNADIAGIPYEDFTTNADKLLYERWKGKDWRTLVRFGFLRKPRLYCYPEKWLLNLENHRSISELKRLRSKLSIANSATKPNLLLIQDLRENIFAIDRQLKHSLMVYFSQMPHWNKRKL
ncbi:hypothetical protein HGH92_26445 [Chitinophaga varians]|uniref:Uncharacterized protein n=1 Tax=Chitinophaga varians TaxID=2202339 RepID=A0A847RXT5_9BACT|nr:hypothetical protein [Chitinophaga varians]NLR67872.1 hypothetical protein [Chitinophaga varians]